MFKFIKQIFIITLIFFNSLSRVDPLEFISLKNQECNVRHEIVNINTNGTIFYPFSIKVNKCSGNCSNISNPYATIWAPDVVKNLNVKVFNLMTLTNETRHMKWHEAFKCICRLDKIICNSNQWWNEDKCRYECKQLIDKDACNKGYFFNTSNCKCKCDKSCGIGEYLDYSNCKCRKKLCNKLIKECAENIDVIKLIIKMSLKKIAVFA